MSTTSNSSKSNSSRSQRKTPEETVHMNVLGRDGTDLDIPNETQKELDTKPPATTLKQKEKEAFSPRRAARSRRISPHPDVASTPVRRNMVDENSGSGTWWGSMWGSKSDEDESASQYQALGVPSSLTEGKYIDPLQRVDSVSPTSASLSSTIEDQLRNDCSFFYQGMEDSSQGKKKYRKMALDRLPQVLSSRENAKFRAQYERLNQDIVVYAGDDLFLDEEAPETIDFQSISNSVKNSSLCYKQNGRLMMKLPRDQVRLIMDEDMGPGIVSVEQWRREDKLSPEGGGESSPPLRFVMTVPDDLYRRVVAEMSHQIFPPCCGLFKCCNEKERADIRWALAIIAVVLLLLFIGTEEYHTQ